MTRIRRPGMVLGTLALSALLFAGCKGTGGGWIPSTTGAEKATFGFTWSNDNGQMTITKGTWSDGYVKFRLTGELGTGGAFNCGGGTVTYVSTNRAYPGPGSVDVSICDDGEPGPSEGDSISVDPTSGPYQLYSNGGILQGGNLQVNQKNL